MVRLNDDIDVVIKKKKTPWQRPNGILWSKRYRKNRLLLLFITLYKKKTLVLEIDSDC